MSECDIIRNTIKGDLLLLQNSVRFYIESLSFIKSITEVSLIQHSLVLSEGNLQEVGSIRSL